MRLCIFVKIVYNKIAVSYGVVCRTRKQRIVRSDFRTLTGTGLPDAGLRQGDHKIGEICYYGR